MITTINDLTHAGFARQSIAMPLGISFFTFQGMSYVIDLYFKKVKVQKNPAYVAFYISFFPQLVAGPIVRYTTIEEQIYHRAVSVEKFVAGAKRFVFGLSKKVIIANSLGYTADLVFAEQLTSNTMASAWVGMLCYSFQIFFDFSGYSDMAIGLGKMFGFDFLENFNYPYISKSITEFWRRWHISLSTWFRDYLYIPLGGNRKGNVYVHLVIVFFATGIWHGASFNFVVWGLWHGAFLIVERVLKIRMVEKEKTGIAFFRWLVTMLIVLVGWVFFRADTLSDAFTYLGVMFGIVQPENVSFTAWFYLTPKACILLAVAAIASLPIAQSRLYAALRKHAAWDVFSLFASLLLLFVATVFIVSSSHDPFIYFRF